MMGDLLTWFVGGTGILVLCLVSHEAGHYFAAKTYGLQPRFGWDKRGWYIDHLPGMPKQNKDIKAAGIVAGYFPLFLGLLVSPMFVLLLWLVWTAGAIREVVEWQNMKK